MRGTVAKRLRRLLGYDMKADREYNNPMERQYGVIPNTLTLVVRGPRAHYQYVKGRYKWNKSVKPRLSR